MKKFLAIIIFISTFSVLSYAQFGSSGGVDAKSTGMAKTYNTTTEGVYSIGINPANLMFTKNHNFEISTLLPIPYFSIRTGTNFASLNEINYFFGKVNGQPRYLNDADKQRFEDLFSSGGLVLANASLNLFSISYLGKENIGAFAFSINDAIEGNFDFPKELIDLGLNGNLIGKDYNLSNANAKAWWIRDYSLSYARDFKNVFPSVLTKFSAGVTLKLVQGFAYASTDSVNAYLSTDQLDAITGFADYRGVSAFSDDFGVKYSFNNDTNQTNSNFSPFPSPAGAGFGLDIGFAASMGQYWRFALSVTDIGSLKWTKNAAQFTSSGHVSVNNISDSTQTNNLKDTFKGQSSSISDFTTSLPTALRLGASYFFDKEHNPIPGTLLLAVDYNQGFNNQPGNSTKPRFSLGAEWKPGDWIPYFRTGFSFGGMFGFHWGLGLGIDAGLLEFNLSTSDFQDVVAPNSAKYFSVAFGSIWKF